MHDDICVSNMDIYLSTAIVFDDLQIQKLCADKCAEGIEDISLQSELLHEMDPSFMLDIVASPRLNRDKNSGHMSKLLAVYCINKRSEFDGNVFEEFTSVEYLPFIHEEAALPLLMLESRLVKESANEKTALTSLQKRCVNALIPILNGSSAKVSSADEKSRQKALKSVPKKVLVELLARSLC